MHTLYTEIYTYTQIQAGTHRQYSMSHRCTHTTYTDMHTWYIEIYTYTQIQTGAHRQAPRHTHRCTHTQTHRYTHTYTLTTNTDTHITHRVAYTETDTHTDTQIHTYRYTPHRHTHTETASPPCRLDCESCPLSVRTKSANHGLDWGGGNFLILNCLPLDRCYLPSPKKPPGLRSCIKRKLNISIS